MGSLEADVLTLLWSRTTPATPAEVLEELHSDLAYTTVMTILTRLWQKDLLDRERVGRAYAYRPRISEAEYAAANMAAALTKVRDRPAALHSFVDNLSGRDAAVLRKLLGDH